MMQKSYSRLSVGSPDSLTQALMTFSLIASLITSFFQNKPEWHVSWPLQPFLSRLFLFVILSLMQAIVLQGTTVCRGDEHARGSRVYLFVTCTYPIENIYLFPQDWLFSFRLCTVNLDFN